jgi:hypothetical protein
MQIRITLQCFASYHAVSGHQLERILRALPFEQDRCTAMVVLWSRVVDREGIYDAFATLTEKEQGQVRPSPSAVGETTSTDS